MTPCMILSVPELDSVFTAYENLVAEVDSVFARVADMYPDCMACKPTCSDCCYAMFDLSLVEAMYLNIKFQENFDFGPQRSSILNRAAVVDRKLTKVKRNYFREFRDGGGSDTARNTVLEEASRERMRCPLLEDDRCLLYPYRPITCRLYGIPAVIGGQTHVCGKTNFTVGYNYSTVRLERIQNRLDKLGMDIRDVVSSRFKELHTVYVPVSMALLTNYDKAYLGIGPAPKSV